MFEKIKKWYLQGLWDATQVAKAVAKDVLTQKQADEILK